jgi:hypothetical protein
MSNKGCIDIVYREWPEELEAWLRVERKLNAIKNDVLLNPAENASNSLFDSEEKVVLRKLLEYLVKEHEKKHGPLSYLLDKFGPSVLMLILREAMGKI